MDKNKKSMIAILIIWGLLAAVLCTAPVSIALAAPTQVITDIYHKHQGTATEGGGCYGRVHYHVCQGDEENGGICYEDSPHVHTDACYREEECIFYNTDGPVVGHKSDHCPAHGPVEFQIVEGVSSHSDCGKGEVASTFIYCPSCGLPPLEIHEYQVVTCGLEDGKYTRNCGKEDGISPEGYELNCGLEGVCGRLILSNETQEESETALLHVQVEDLTGGKLILSSEPYTWYDENGTPLGEGEFLEVDKNGTYQAEVHLENRDVEEEGLISTISVDTIGAQDRPTLEASASPGAEGTSKPGTIPEGTATPGTTPAPSAAPEPVDNAERWEDTGESGQMASPSPKPSNTPGAAPTETPAVSAHNGGETPQGSFHGQKDGSALKAAENALPSKSPKGENTKKLTKTEQTVTLPEAMEDIVIEVQPVKKSQGFWERPVVRTVTITLSTLLLMMGVLLLLFYFRRSVRLYNDNGEGRWIYLGRLLVHTQEEYTVTIPEKFIEKAYTNRYGIRPGLFLIGRTEEELLICEETKRIAVPLSREMVVML